MTMSLNPSIGHLYHDHNISNDFTALDAKEKLRTREINAREAKYLDRYSNVIDRAKSTCLKHNAWTQREIRRTLENIQSKTPSLSKGLCEETERKRVRELRRNALQNGFPGLPEERYAKARSSTCKPKLSSLLSPWSVYPQRQGSYGRTETSTSYDRNHSKRSNSGSSKSCQKTTCLTKTDQLVRKADHIIKALHSLYTKGIERKHRENSTTVLEILGRDSKEELEKALFVLRGTATGDAIEDILREKELVSKARNGRINSNATDQRKQVSVSEILIARNDTGDTRNGDKGSHVSLNSNARSKDSGLNSPTSADRILLSLDDVHPDTSDDSSLDNVFVEEIINTKPDHNAPSIDIGDVFEKDATWAMSSVLANPSETGYQPRAMKWTQLLKAPELWKTDTRANKTARLNNPKPLSLVTLTGKRRRTLLKK